MVQHLSMMVRPADKMQWVAVMGLSLKLPKVCRYCWAVMHIARTEVPQAARAFSDRSISCDFSPSFCEVGFVQCGADALEGW